MSENYIYQFSLKTSGMFSLEDSISIQELLKNASDDAFPILMMHKVHRYIFVNVLLWIFLLVCAFFFVSGVILYMEMAVENYYRETELIMSISFFLTSLALGILDIVLLAKLKPSKKKAFKEYSTILLHYQKQK